ncbi:hypothetical protein Tco_0040034 [Tanacetum coccineum]
MPMIHVLVKVEWFQVSDGSFPISRCHGLTRPKSEWPYLGRIVRNYEFLVPTGSTQFLLVVRFSLPGLLESPGLMESIKRHSVEFRRISMTGFRSCTSRSHYRSVSKQTTRLPMDIRLKIDLENQSDLTSHLPRACLMLPQSGFPSSL